MRTVDISRQYIARAILVGTCLAADICRAAIQRMDKACYVKSMFRVDLQLGSVRRAGKHDSEIIPRMARPNLRFFE